MRGCGYAVCGKDGRGRQHAPIFQGLKLLLLLSHGFRLKRLQCRELAAQGLLHGLLQRKHLRPPYAQPRGGHAVTANIGLHRDEALVHVARHGEQRARRANSPPRTAALGSLSTLFFAAPGKREQMYPLPVQLYDLYVQYCTYLPELSIIASINESD